MCVTLCVYMSVSSAVFVLVPPLPFHNSHPPALSLSPSLTHTHIHTNTHSLSRAFTPDFTHCTLLTHTHTSYEKNISFERIRLLRIVILVKFGSRALYIEQLNIFKILLNYYFRQLLKPSLLFSYFWRQTSSVSPGSSTDVISCTPFLICEITAVIHLDSLF